MGIRGLCIPILTGTAKDWTGAGERKKASLFTPWRVKTMSKIGSSFAQKEIQIPSIFLQLQLTLMQS